MRLAINKLARVGWIVVTLLGTASCSSQPSPRPAVPNPAAVASSPDPQPQAELTIAGLSPGETYAQALKTRPQPTAIRPRQSFVELAWTFSRDQAPVHPDSAWFYQGHLVAVKGNSVERHGPDAVMHGDQPLKSLQNLLGTGEEKHGIYDWWWARWQLGASLTDANVDDFTLVAKAYADPSVSRYPWSRDVVAPTQLDGIELGQQRQTVKAAPATTIVYSASSNAISVNGTLLRAGDAPPLRLSDHVRTFLGKELLPDGVTDYEGGIHVTAAHGVVTRIELRVDDPLLLDALKSSS